MIPHYALNVTAGCSPSLSFANGAHTTSYVFPHGRSRIGSALHTEHLPGGYATLECGELFFNPELRVSTLKELSNKERLIKMAEIGAIGFLEIFKEIASIFDILKQEHEKVFGVPPAACISVWRSRPVALTADSYSQGYAAVGYSTFGNLSMVVASALPDECEQRTPVALPSYVNPGPLVDGDFNSGKGRRELALHATSGVRLNIPLPV